jgi:phospholipid/cholesterol/gamma-HCH transport system substrate-binding protein
MKNHLAAAGVFVISAVVLFSLGLFLIGDHHKAFSHHLDFYTDLTNVNGLPSGAKVRVSCFDAGQLINIQIPDRPSGKFRLKLHVDDKLSKLIRTDSLVSVESDGLVGDKFILIHDGSDQAAQAANGATLPSKEPIELSAVIAKATNVIDEANAAIGDVTKKADGALDAITTTVNNTNGIVTGIRQGHGTAGMLLNDKQTADDVKAAVTNTRQATANLNQASLQTRQVITDFQSRNLFGKASDTLDSARHASQQLDQGSQQVNATLNEALGSDRSGENAAENLRETLSNVNLATQNVADDTEALKHEFFFRGFFKKRGFFSLSSLTPDEYRANTYFQRVSSQRSWLSGGDAFTLDSQGTEILSPTGRHQIDQIIGNAKNSIAGQPVVVEGYAANVAPADQLSTSRARAILVKQYLEKRFHLLPKDVGVISLNATPPISSGKSSWDGACIVFLAKPK